MEDFLVGAFAAFSVPSEQFDVVDIGDKVFFNNSDENLLDNGKTAVNDAFGYGDAVLQRGMDRLACIKKTVGRDPGVIVSFVNEFQGPGYFTLPLPVSSWSKGVYIQVFKAGSFERRETITTVR
jgi:hypothetical protein